MNEEKGTVPEAIKIIVNDVLGYIAGLEDIYILGALESGSRAWGFHSHDSDYDVRFLYIRKLDRYLSYTGQPDTLDRKVHRNPETSAYIRKVAEIQDVDIVGWDITKVFFQMVKGNPVLCEWLNSTFWYQTQEASALSAMRYKAMELFKGKAGIYHYEHMARKNFNQYLRNPQGDVILKKYLYVMRPLFAMAWIHCYNFPPPMWLENLMVDDKVSHLLGPTITKFTQKLINAKRQGDELGLGPRDNAVNVLVEKALDEFKKIGDSTDVVSPTNDQLVEIDQFQHLTIITLQEKFNPEFMVKEG